MYRSRAPLRLGLAGGGTDVSPYSDDFGGAILNATINLYSYAVITERNDGKIKCNESFQINDEPKSSEVYNNSPFSALKNLVCFLLRDNKTFPFGLKIILSKPE